MARSKTCGCSPAEASEMLEKLTAAALEGDQGAAADLGMIVEHALRRGGLLAVPR